MTITALRPLSPEAILRATASRLVATRDLAALALTSRLRHHAPAPAKAPRFDALVCAVFDTLTAAAPAALDRPELARDVLVTLALHLRDHGMAPRGYIALHAAFLDMVEDRLGTDPVVTSAWERATGSMLATMMAAAHGPRSHTTPLAA